MAGLGNPGPQYTGTFHNLGADVVHVLAERHGGRLKRTRHRAMADEVRMGGHRVALAFPLTFMNESGQAVGALMRWYGIGDPARLIVVHDELDLEPGRLKVKVGGGLAGHNGLRSIANHLGSQDFLRVRIGVGKPPSSDRGADHVLGRIPRRLREEMSTVVQEAADCVETLVAEGPVVAMDRHNR